MMGTRKRNRRKSGGEGRDFLAWLRPCIVPRTACVPRLACSR